MLYQETNQHVDDKPRFYYGFIVVVSAFFIMFLGLGFYNTFGVFFKPMISEFGWSRALASGAFSLSSFIRGLSGILMGSFTDRFGARKVLTICGLLIGAGYLLLSQINSAWQLYLLYVVLLGIGMSGVWVPLLSTIAKWFTKRRSMMTGIVVAGLNISTLALPPVTNWLISLYDWRITYIIMGGVVLVIVVSAAQLLRQPPIQTRQLPNSASKIEDGTSKPGVDGFSLKEAIKTSQFWLATGMVFCIGLWRIAVLVHIVPHATDLGFSALSSANILATIGGVSILGSVIGGSVSDRLGSRWAYIISFILMSVASLWLLQARDLRKLYLFAIIFGLGSGINGPLLSPLLAGIFGLGSHGMIFGVANFSYTIGAGIGPFLTGYIFDLTGSYQIAFLVCLAVSVIGLIMAAVLRPTKKLGGKI